MLSVFCAHESWVLWAFSASTSANRTIFLFHKHKHGSVQYAHVYVCVRARTCVCAYVEGAHTQTAHACKEQCNSFIIIIEKWKLTKMTNRTEKKNIKQFRATTNRSSFQLSILRIKEGKKRGKIQLWCLVLLSNIDKLPFFRFLASARQLAKALEVPLVNDLGYTKRYVRCLQVMA